MSDENAIRNIVAQYCLLADAKRFSELSKLFSEDGTLSFKGTEMARGPAALEESFAKSEIPPGNHLSLNVAVGVDGSTGTLQSNFMYVDADKNITTVGKYDASLIKVGADWKIKIWSVDFW